MSLHYGIVGRRAVRAGLLQLGDRGGTAAVADRHREIAPQAGDLRPRHGAALDEAAKLVIGAAPQLDERRQIEAGARSPRGIRRAARQLVVRADFLADVAAIDVRPYCRAVLVRDLATELAREARA